MSFVERAESWRAKAHLSGVRLPILVGMTALAGLVLVFAGRALVDAAYSDGFTVEHADQVQEQGEGEGDANQDESTLVKTIVVHVGGAVADPGVCELEEGSRVQDAVEAAGGFADGAARDALNLARVLVDGEQVVVPTLEEQKAAASSPEGEPAAAGGGKVNINVASATELDALPGVGPATAEKIVADREANGPFAAVEDLKRVAGIGDKKFADLADLVCVG